MFITGQQILKTLSFKSENGVRGRGLGVCLTPLTVLALASTDIRILFYQCNLCI